MEIGYGFPVPGQPCIQSFMSLPKPPGLALNANTEKRIHMNRCEKEVSV